MDTPEQTATVRRRRKPAAAPPAPETGAAPPQETRTERPPLRTDPRGDVREESPRTAADIRAKEILEHLGSLDQGTDDFYVDPKTIPDGWTYEWKRNTVYGQADPAYEVALSRTGWEPVPSSRHPEMMPQDWTGNVITRKGQILMERPKSITDLVVSRDKRVAREQVQVKEAQLSSAPKDQLPRASDAGGDARTKPSISKSYEPMPIPADKK